MANDNIYVGRDLGWVTLETGAKAIDEFIAISGDDNPWYRTASPFGGPILPAMFFHSLQFRDHSGWFLEDRYGTLFARQRFQWSRPLLVGEPARSHAWVSEIQRKGERWHVTCDVDIYNANDDIALRSRTTQSFLVDTTYRGVVRNPDTTRPKRASTSAIPEGAGSTAFTPTRTFVSTEACVRFFAGSSNYHTDVEESKKMGFGDIVVGGPMSVCYIGKMLTDNLGRDLFVGADLDIRLIDILWANAEVTILGSRLADPLPELSRSRFPFHVEVQDPAGRMTVVANGSYATTSPA